MINTGKTVAMSYHTKQSKFPMRPNITYRNTDIAYEGINEIQNFLVYILQEIWNELLIYAY